MGDGALGGALGDQRAGRASRRDGATLSLGAVAAGRCPRREPDRWGRVWLPTAVPLLVPVSIPIPLPASNQAATAWAPP